MSVSGSHADSGVDCSSVLECLSQPDCDKKKRLRGPRSIESIRARRKRQRYSKKCQRKEKWKKMLIESTCKRWKECRVEYEQAVADAEVEEQKNREVIAEELATKEEHRRIKEKCVQEISSCQEEEYNSVSASSLLESNDALLLPSVVVPDASYPRSIAIPESVTGVDRVAVKSALELERHKTLEALREAQYYRNLSERMRKEKREMANSLNDKLELVRDFWRNKIQEGTTRAGKIVQMALNKRHSSATS